LAGALFLFNAGRFSGNVSGYGFLGIAIMVAGVWKIQWISLITVSFSLFTALTYSNILSNLGWPKDIVSTIPYFITIFVLIWFAKHSKGPEAVGIPFDNSSRF
jgi:simple sugar transport system permease protein